MFDSWETFWNGKPGCPFYDPFCWFATPEGTKTPGNFVNPSPSVPTPNMPVNGQAPKIEQRPQKFVGLWILGGLAFILSVILLIPKRKK